MCVRGWGWVGLRFERGGGGGGGGGRVERGVYACFLEVREIGLADKDTIGTIRSRRANSQKIHIHHTGLLHIPLSYTVNHSEHLSYFMQLYNRMTIQVLAFL